MVEEEGELDVDTAFRKIRDGFDKLEDATHESDRAAELVCGEVSGVHENAGGRDDCELTVKHTKFGTEREATLDVNRGLIEQG